MGGYPPVRVVTQHLRQLQAYGNQTGFEELCVADGEQGFGERQEGIHVFESNLVHLGSWPDGTAKGAQEELVCSASFSESLAECHVVRDQIVDVHRSPSRLKSPTMRKAVRLTLA